MVQLLNKHGIRRTLASMVQAELHDTTCLMSCCAKHSAVPEFQQSKNQPDWLGKMENVLSGLTLVPWSAMQISHTWDVTVADTFAQTNLPQTVHRSGAAAEAAAERKIRLKYASIATKHMFVPVAFETLGPICSDGVNLIAYDW